MVLRRTLLPDAEPQTDRRQLLQRRVDDALRDASGDVDKVLELAFEILESDMLSPSERENFVRVLEAETGLDLRRHVGAEAPASDAKTLAREIALDARGPAPASPAAGILQAMSDNLLGRGGRGRTQDASARQARTDADFRVERGEGAEKTDGPTVAAPDAETAAKVGTVVERYAPELGVNPKDVDVVVSKDGPGAGRLGLMHDGRIELDAKKVDAEKAEGRAVVAHELAHMAQLQAPGTAIANPMRRIGKAETEADAVFKAALLGEALPTPTEKLAPVDEAACGPATMNEEQIQPQPITPQPIQPEPIQPEPIQPEPEEPVPGEGDCLECPEPDLEHQSVQPLQTLPPREAQPGQRELDLSIAGRRLRVLIPEDAAPGEVRVQLQDRDSPFTALKLRSAVLHFDANMNIERGEIQAGVELGNYVHVDNVTLQVDRNGRVDVHIRNCEVQVNEDIRARVDLVIGPDGFHGAATVTAEAISLGPLYTIKDALLHVRIDANGAVSAHGEITFEVNGLFAVKLEACYVDGEWRGRLTFIWEMDIELFPGVVLTQATITGCFSKNHWWIFGTATLNVVDHFQVDASIKYEWKEGQSWWHFIGEVNQHTPLPLVDGVNLEDVHAYIEWKKDHWEPARFKARITHEYVEGDLEGTWDIEKGEVDAEGGVQLVKPIELGPGGARMEEAFIRAYVVKNELTEIKGAVSFILPFENEDTFEVAAEDLSYRFKDKKFNGFVTATLLRDLQFGNPDGINAIVYEGAGAVAMIQDNAFGGMQAGLEFHVFNAQTAVGQGEITFDMDPDFNFTGKATFSLIEDWGIPHQELGPVFLLTGGYFELSVNNRTLGHAEAKNVKFEIYRPEGPGCIAGELAGRLDFDTRLGDFTGSAWVEEGWPLLEGEWGTFTMVEGGRIDVGIAQSKVTKLEGFLPFKVDVNANQYTDAFTVSGHVKGAYNPDSQKVNGELLATLETPLEIRVPETAGHKVVVCPGTFIKATVTESEPDLFTMDLLAQYYDGPEILLEGGIAGARYDFKKGEFDFTGHLTLKRELRRELTGDGGWSIAAVPDVTTFEVVVEKSKVQRAGGRVVVWVYEGEEVLLEGDLEGEVTFDPEVKFNGLASLTLKKRLEWPRPGSQADVPVGYSFFLDEGSKLTGMVEDNALSRVELLVLFGVGKGGEDLALGFLTGAWDFTSNKFDLAGQVKLVRNWYFNDTVAPENEKDPSKWRFGLEEGSMLAFDIQQNVFQEASVTVYGILERGVEKVARGDLVGIYKPGGGFNGLATLDMLTDVHLTDAGRFGMYLGSKTHIDGTITESQLTSASLLLEILAKEQETDKASLTFTADWAGGSTFSGSAELKVLDPIQLGNPVTIRGQEYTTWLSPETGGRIEIVDNKPTVTSGNLTIEMTQGEATFARGSFDIAYDFRNPDAGITAEGSLQLLETITLGTAAGYTFYLQGGSGISGRIEENSLKWIEGQLSLGVETAEDGLFATLDIQGKYTGGEEPEFSGSATATVHSEYDLGFTALGYGFFLQPSSGFTIELEKSEFKRFGGIIGIIARQSGGGEEGMQGDVIMLLDGSGVKEGSDWIFNGSATAEVTGNINVGTAGDYAFSIQGGTGLSLSVVNNRFTQIEGTLKGKVTEAGQDFLGFECWVRYDAGESEGDPGFVDAQGSCKLLGEKELYNQNGYVFSVLPTEGPTAIINVQRNEVKEVGGELAFRLENNTDATNPLKIKGTARGLYNNDTGKFSGSGDIRLESDLNFKLNADGTTKIVLKAGSGGMTEIEENKLLKLGGTLIGELWTEGQPLVGLNAEGRYNAVTNKLEHFEGEASLLRNLNMGPEGNPYLIVHQGLSANILITDNKLMRLEANNGHLSVPSLNLEGGFTYLKYSCESGQDEYSANGWIQVEMLKDQADKGRYLRGKIDFTYNPDDTWSADGTVDFKINHYIGGQATAHIDQELDPKLGGTLNIGPANVMEGRELFKKKIKLFAMTMRFAAGPVPISLNIGAEGSLGVDMLPLRMWGSVGFDNFYPKRMNTPSFTATAGMDWGLRIKAALMAYADARVDVAVASLGLGLLGQAEVTGDALATGDVTLNADGGKYWGELGLGLKFAPTASVAVKPYVVAGLVGKDFKHEFEGLSLNLGELFSWEYGKTFKFGDQPEAPSDGAPKKDVPTGGIQQNTSAQTSAADAQKLGQENLPAAPAAKAGEPGMESGADMAGDQKEAKEGTSGDSEVDDKMKMIGEIGEVAGAVADIVSQVLTLIGAAMLGPIAFVLVICWKWVTGDLGRLVDNLMKVLDFWTNYKHMLEPYLPGWWKGFVEFCQNPSSAIDKWWNGDVYTRQAVAANEHVGTPADVRGKMCETLFSGICAEGDRRALETIFEYSIQRGDLNAVLDASGYDGNSYQNSWWRHGDWGGSKLKRMWDAQGIDY